MEGKGGPESSNAASGLGAIAAVLAGQLSLYSSTSLSGMLKVPWLCLVGLTGSRP